MKVINKDNKIEVGIRYTDIDTLLSRKDVIVNTLENTLKREIEEGTSNRSIENVMIVFREDDFILKIIIKENN